MQRDGRAEPSRHVHPHLQRQAQAAGMTLRAHPRRHPPAHKSRHRQGKHGTPTTHPFTNVQIDAYPPLGPCRAVARGGTPSPARASGRGRGCVVISRWEWLHWSEQGRGDGRKKSRRKAHTSTHSQHTRGGREEARGSVPRDDNGAAVFAEHVGADHLQVLRLLLVVVRGIRRKTMSLPPHFRARGRGQTLSAEPGPTSLGMNTATTGAKL